MVTERNNQLILKQAREAGGALSAVGAVPLVVAAGRLAAPGDRSLWVFVGGCA